MAEERNNVTDSSEDESGTDKTSRADSVVNSGDSVEEDTGSPDQIKERIEETRSQMGETIDAIQERLSFSNLSEQVTEQVSSALETAKSAVYDATIGKVAIIMKNVSDELTSSSVINTVKQNPLPFILIGAGAGLLAYQSLNGSKSAKTTDRFRLKGNSQEGFEHNKQLESNGPGKSGGIADSVTGAASGAYDAITGAASSVYAGAGDAMSGVRGKAGELGTAARESYDTYIETNPLAVGAVALAMGAAVGLAIPSTNYEGQLFGSARQKLMDSAESTATGLIDRTKEAVTEAGRNIADQVAGHPETTE